MFKNLTNFGYKRNFVEALGFYLAYLLLVMLVGGLFGVIVGLAYPDNAYYIALRVGTVVSIVINLGLSFQILKQKNLLGNFGYLILTVISAIISAFLGGLGGLIPVAFFTTREKK